MTAAPIQQFDFSNMPLTNEQKILETLLRIEVLLTPAVITVETPVVEVKPSRAEQIAALAAKAGTRRK